jgi:PAS domain-containing protein
MSAALLPTPLVASRTTEMANAALDSIRQAVVWTDGVGAIVGGNAAFSMLLERPVDELLGQALLPLTPLWRNGHRISGEEHPVARAVRGEFGSFGDFEIAGRGAIHRWLEIAAVRALNGEGLIFSLSCCRMWPSPPTTR